MRTALWMAIGLSAVVWVPASFAQDSRVPDHGRPAGTGVQADMRQSHDKLSGGLRSEPRSHAGVHVAVPIGKVSVGPGLVEGEPSYVRRTMVRDGMTIVEVSATPFMPDLPSTVAELIVRPDQPAAW